MFMSRRLIAAALTSAVVFSALPLLPAAAATAPIAVPVATAPANAYPASVDLRTWAVKPGDQGTSDSCISWAVGHTLMGWYARRAGYTTTFAPMYLYSQTHLDNSASGGGSSIWQTYNIAATQGVAPRRHFYLGDSVFDAAPNADETAAAAPYKLTDRTVLFADLRGGGAVGADQVKATLAAGTPVGLTMPLSDGLDNLNSSHYTLTAAAGAPRGGYHYLIALGYDAKGVWVENSWGSAWGRDGFARLTWGYLRSRVIEADHIDGFRAPLPVPPAPAAPARVRFWHEGKDLRVFWQPGVTRGDALVRTYRVIVRFHGKTKHYTVSGDRSMLLIHGLRPRRSYAVSVAAVSDGGTSKMTTRKVRTPPR